MRPATDLCKFHSPSQHNVDLNLVEWRSESAGSVGVLRVRAPSLCCGGYFFVLIFVVHISLDYQARCPDCIDQPTTPKIPVHFYRHLQPCPICPFACQDKVFLLFIPQPFRLCPQKVFRDRSDFPLRDRLAARQFFISIEMPKLGIFYHHGCQSWLFWQPR